MPGPIETKLLPAIQRDNTAVLTDDERVCLAMLREIDLDGFARSGAARHVEALIDRGYIDQTEATPPAFRVTDVGGTLHARDLVLAAPDEEEV